MCGKVESNKVYGRKRCMEEMFCFLPILFEIIVICKRLLLVIRNRSKSGWWLVLYNCFSNLWFKSIKKHKKTGQIKTTSIKTKIQEQKIISTSLAFNEVTFCMGLPNGLWLFNLSHYSCGCCNLRTLLKICALVGPLHIQCKIWEISYELWEELWIPEFCLYAPSSSRSYIILCKESECWWSFKMNGNSVVVIICK